MTRTRSGSSSASGSGRKPMTSPPTTSTIGYGIPTLRATAERPATATSSVTRTSSTSCNSDGLEAGDPAQLDLLHLVALDQQIDVAEHLAQRQVRLRHRHVPP